MMKNNKDANDNSKLYRRELKPVKLKSGIEDIKQDFRERKEQGDTKYGIEILDDAVDTIRNGSTTFIVALPNCGKSLWSQIIANNLAKQGRKVMICSCEMGAGLLMERELRMLSGQSMQMVRDLYNVNEYEAEMLLDSVYDMPQYEYLDNIEICETAGATVHDIIKMLNAFPEFDYVVVDYIQRIQGSGSDYEVITEAARELQNHARQTRKKIIICSQASRQSGSDAKYGKEIDTSRIKGKGSGSIEEDADVGLSLLEVEEDEGRFILATLFKNRYNNFKNITYKYKVTGRLELKLQQRSL